MKNPIKTIDRRSLTPLAGAISLLPATGLYLLLAVYLYAPYLSSFKPPQYLFVFNSVAAATGAFCLSRRWIKPFVAALFAGAMYGFSPLAIGFSAYHPVAGLPLAFLPWVFLPAVLARRPRSATATIPAKIVTAGFYALPFVLLVAFFWLCAQPWLRPFFPLPKYARLHIANQAAIVAPLAIRANGFIFSLYHLPVAVAVVGLLMNIKAHRLVVLIAVVTTLALAFSTPILEVPPVIWALVPALYCSIAIGLGMHGLVLAGPADSKWSIAAVITAAALAATTFALSFTRGSAYLYAAEVHTLALVLTAAIFFMARARLRWRLFRWALLSAGLALDIILGARYLIDTIL